MDNRNILKAAIAAALLAMGGQAFADGEAENSFNAAVGGSAVANDEGTANVTTDNTDSSSYTNAVTKTDTSDNTKTNTSTSDTGGASATDDSLAIGVANSLNGNGNVDKDNVGNWDNSDNSNNAETNTVGATGGSASAADNATAVAATNTLNNNGNDSSDNSDNSDNSIVGGAFGAAVANNGGTSSVDKSTSEERTPDRLRHHAVGARAIPPRRWRDSSDDGRRCRWG
jgi:hypothetical protein